jgi:hypothetical protein
VRILIREILKKMTVGHRADHNWAGTEREGPKFRFGAHECKTIHSFAGEGVKPIPRNCGTIHEDALDFTFARSIRLGREGGIDLITRHRM